MFLWFLSQWIPTLIPAWVYWLLTLELACVSWGDVRSQKIPNAWSILNIVLFLALLVIHPEVYPLHWSMFAYSLVFLVVGFGLFLMRIMGGGDSKFLCTFFLLIPSALQPDALIRLLISTLLIGSFMLLTNVVKHHEKIINAVKIRHMAGIRECFGTKFSFAPVVLLAWLWLGWERGLMPW